MPFICDGGLYPSNFFKSSFKPDSVALVSEPDDRFRGSGPEALINGSSANFALRSEEWVGFHNNRNIYRFFKLENNVSSVTLNVMINPGGSIYPPASLEIGATKDRMQLLKRVKPAPVSKNDTTKVARLTGIACNFAPRNLTWLKVVSTAQKLPAGYVTLKGKTSPKVYLLVNEVLFN